MVFIDKVRLLSRSMATNTASWSTLLPPTAATGQLPEPGHPTSDYAAFVDKIDRFDLVGVWT